MQYVDLLSLISNPAVIIDVNSRNICNTNEAFRKMHTEESKASLTIANAPQFVQSILERLICAMKDLDALTMPCSMPVNGKSRMISIVCQYSDYAAKEKIVAVFCIDAESKMTPLENNLISEFVSCGIVILDIKPEGPVFRYANNSFYQLTGYTPDEYKRIYDHDFFELIYEEKGLFWYKKAKKQISQNGQFHIDGRIKCKDGVIKWVNILGKMYKGFDGKPVFYVVITDITESLQLREQLYLEQQSFSAIECISKDIVFKYDYNSKLITLSGALLFKLTGVFEVECSIEDLVNGKSVISFEPEQVKQIIKSVKTDKHKEFPICAQNRQEDKRWLSLDYYSIHKQDDVAVSAVGVISDITEEIAAKDFYDKAITLWSSKQDACVSALAINISNGTIISGFSKIFPNTKMDGFDGKLYSKEFFKRVVDDTIRTKLKTSLLRKNLIKAYKEGQTHFSYEIEINDNGELGWYQMTGSLHKNPKTDDLILLLKWRDINGIKLQQKINDLLFYKEYDFICCIFARIDSYIIVSDGENRTIIPRSLTLGYEATVKEYIEKYGDPQDKDYIEYSFSIKNLRKHLSRNPTYSFAVHGKYPGGSPTVKLNSFIYLDKSREIILYTRKDITNKTEVLSFKIENSVQNVPFRDIIYVESFGKRSIIVTKHEKYNVNEMLSSIQVRLPGRDFMRCHRCYIVRYDSMQKIEKYTVTMSNGDKVSANRSSVEIIRKKLREP